MDPDQAWETLLNSVQLLDWGEVREHAESLLNWLRKGGFPPVICDSLDEHENRDIAVRTCLTAIQLSNALIKRDS